MAAEDEKKQPTRIAPRRAAVQGRETLGSLFRENVELQQNQANLFSLISSRACAVFTPQTLDLVMVDANMILGLGIDWDTVESGQDLVAGVASYLNLRFGQFVPSEPNYLTSYRSNIAFSPKTATSKPELNRDVWIMFQSHYWSDFAKPDGWCGAKPRIIRIWTEGHILVAVWHPKENAVEIFDSLGTDNKAKTEKSDKYVAYFRQLLGNLTTIKVVNERNIQACGEKEDIYCQTWGLWYLFQRFWVGKSPDQIRGFLQQIPDGPRQAMIQEFYHNLRANFPAIKRPSHPMALRSDKFKPRD